MFSHTIDKRRQQCNTMNKDGKRWVYYHTQWIRDDSNGILWTEMDSDG